MTAHARLSPSAADRWMTCAGSVRLIERLTAAGRIDPRSSSGAADEGTAAHQVRSDCLDLGLDAWAFEGTSFRVGDVDYVCDADMAGHLQPGIDWVREQPGEVIVEHRVDLSDWMPGQFGTLDTGIIDRAGRRLCVNDLKYGAGVPVDAVGNRQLRIYALGIVSNFDLRHAVDRVDLVIDQPRAGGMKPWSVSTDDLLAFGEEVVVAARRVDDPDAPLVVSEKGCKFCEVKSTVEGCPAYDAWMNEILGDALADLEDFDAEPAFPEPTTIDPARRWYIVKHSHLATQWLAKLHEDSMSAAEAGSPDPGSKLVAGRRGRRRFGDAERAEAIMVEAMGDDAYTKSLKSLTEAEKELAPKRGKPGHPTAWASLSALIVQDEGRPILASDDDPRPALPTLLADLDQLEDL